MTTTDSDQPTTELAHDALTSNDADDVYHEQLPGRPLRKPLGRLSYLLLAALVAAGTFYAGVRVEKAHAARSTSGLPSSIASLFARGGPSGLSGGSGAGGATAAPSAIFGGSASGGGTTGTIKLVDGSNVYIQQADGTIIRALTTPSSKITVTSTGTLTQLHPGDTVTVTGTSGSNGTISATAIKDSGTGNN